MGFSFPCYSVGIAHLVLEHKGLDIGPIPRAEWLEDAIELAYSLRSSGEMRLNEREHYFWCNGDKNITQTALNIGVPGLTTTVNDNEGGGRKQLLRMPATVIDTRWGSRSRVARVKLKEPLQSLYITRLPAGERGMRSCDLLGKVNTIMGGLNHGVFTDHTSVEIPSIKWACTDDLPWAHKTHFIEERPNPKTKLMYEHEFYFDICHKITFSLSPVESRFTLGKMTRMSGVLLMWVIHRESPDFPYFIAEIGTAQSPCRGKKRRKRKR